MKKNKNKFIFRKIKDGKIHICYARAIMSWNYLCGVRTDVPEDKIVDEAALTFYENVKLSPKLILTGVCRSCLKSAINATYGKLQKTVKIEKKTEIDDLFDDLIANIAE